MALQLRQQTYHKMAVSRENITSLNGKISIKIILSYAFDWVILLLFGVIAAILGDIEPHKRPFPLSDPNISLPYTKSEAVPLWLLGILIGAFPLVTILVVTLVFVPGPTAPRQTPAALKWRRKLWEFHVATLGLLTAHVVAFFFTQGMKCLFGKPRPDFLERCEPDLNHASDHAVGDLAGEGLVAQLYSASICTQVDLDILDDGFRSFPSGHSSAAAAGLVYLSLFLASKLAVGIPFVLPGASAGVNAHVAFPSRMVEADPIKGRLPTIAEPIYGRQNWHGDKHQSLRTQAAAPPVYLLAIVLVPFALSIYISASRWFDFRHHGFDILFGYLIGFIPAVFAFRLYHLPILGGAGWAWGSRCHDRAFWAGVGRTGYRSSPDEEAAVAVQVQDDTCTRCNESDCGQEDLQTQRSLAPRPASTRDDAGLGTARANSSQANNPNGDGHNAKRRNGSNLSPRDGGSLAEYFDIEMQQMNRR